MAGLSHNPDVSPVAPAEADSTAPTTPEQVTDATRQGSAEVAQSLSPEQQQEAIQSVFADEHRETVARLQESGALQMLDGYFAPIRRELAGQQTTSETRANIDQLYGLSFAALALAQHAPDPVATERAALQAAGDLARMLDTHIAQVGGTVGREVFMQPEVRALLATQPELAQRFRPVRVFADRIQADGIDLQSEQLPLRDVMALQSHAADYLRERAAQIMLGSDSIDADEFQRRGTTFLLDVAEVRNMLCDSRGVVDRGVDRHGVRSVGPADGHMTIAAFDTWWAELQRSDHAIAELTSTTALTRFSDDIADYASDEDGQTQFLDDRMAELRSTATAEMQLAANPHGLTMRKYGDLFSVLAYSGKELLLAGLALTFIQSGFSLSKTAMDPTTWALGGAGGYIAYHFGLMNPAPQAERTAATAATESLRESLSPDVRAVLQGINTPDDLHDPDSALAQWLDRAARDPDAPLPDYLEPPGSAWVDLVGVRTHDTTRDELAPAYQSLRQSVGQRRQLIGALQQARTHDISLFTLARQ